MARILIVHGWMHSIRRYSRLKKDLEEMGHEVVVMRQKGFGGVQETEEPEGDFDVTIGHSLGGNYLIRNQERFKNSSMFLVAPVYKPVKVPRILIPMLRYYGRVEDKVQNKSPEFFKSAVNNILVWMASMTLHRKEAMDSLLFEDVNIADKNVAAETLHYLINLPKVKAVPQHAVIIRGTKDKLVAKKGVEQLSEDMNALFVEFPDIGHTPFMEDYDATFTFLLELIDERVREVAI